MMVAAPEATVLETVSSFGVTNSPKNEKNKTRGSQSRSKQEFRSK